VVLVVAQVHLGMRILVLQVNQEHQVQAVQVELQVHQEYLKQQAQVELQELQVQ